MNKELELEAEKYENSFNDPTGNEAIDFIAGATSKYVEKQKLEFAIEQLKQIESHYKGSAFGMVQNKIKELEQKLNNL